MIAAKNHRNGTKNPLAHLRKDFGFDFCNTVSDKNPIVAEPLRVTDCSLISDGDLPINLSGGLKSKGHPVGATGVSMHVMAAMQLTGAAGEFQKDDAELGCVFNMGGSGVANYCSVLERRH